MATMKDPKGLVLAYIEAGGQKQFDLLSAFFHDNLEFEGRFATFHGAQVHAFHYPPTFCPTTRQKKAPAKYAGGF